MDVKEYIEKSVYSDGNGISAYLDDNITMKLNEIGLYSEVFREGVTEIKDDILNTTPHLLSDVNESIISSKLFSDIDGIKHDSNLGYYKSLYVGHVQSANVRGNSSSGGIGTWILIKLLSEGHIDGVIHVKETENDEILFKYQISRTVEEISEGSKTKYYPVELSEVLRTVREVPGKYAIVGIPSFIYSVKLLSEVDPIIKERIVFTVGLICGHQKSSKFSESMAWQSGILPGNLSKIDYRKKLPGRKSDQYGVEMTGIVNGKTINITKPTSDLVGQNWGMGFFKANASDYVDDVMNETADITIGDAWLPEYTDQSEGNNVIIIRNPIIDSLFSENAFSRELVLDSVGPDTIFRSQSSHFRHTRDELAYRLYLKDKAREWRPVKRVEASKNIPAIRRYIQKLRLHTAEKSHSHYKESVAENNFSRFSNKSRLLTKKYKASYKMLGLSNLGFSGVVRKIIRKFR